MKMKSISHSSVKQCPKSHCATCNLKLHMGWLHLCGAGSASPEAPLPMYCAIGHARDAMLCQNEQDIDQYSIFLGV